MAERMSVNAQPIKPAQRADAEERGRPEDPLEGGIENRIYDDYDALSRAAAALFTECARETLQDRQHFRVVLSGGETPARMFALLADAPLREEVPWSRLQVFWGDERWVPLDDERSNAGQTRRQLLDRVPLAADQVYPMVCGATPAAAALAYEEQIRRQFGNQPPCFDLIFLGLGTEGHTASLFPGSDLITETQRWVREVPRGPAGLARVSFTPLLINQAAVVAFLVSGENKADTVRVVQQEPRQPEHYPAQAIQPKNGRLVWLLDRAAAARLSGS
jgi:6-phosphogluconolactonase